MFITVIFMLIFFWKISWIECLPFDPRFKRQAYKLKPAKMLVSFVYRIHVKPLHAYSVVHKYLKSIYQAYFIKRPSLLYHSRNITLFKTPLTFMRRNCEVMWLDWWNFPSLASMRQNNGTKTEKCNKFTLIKLNECTYAFLVYAVVLSMEVAGRMY